MRQRKSFLNLLKCLQIPFVAIPLLLVSLHAAVSPQQLTPPNSSVPQVLFGIHIHGMVVPRPGLKEPTSWPSVPFGTWRLWDAYVGWPQLEPKQGTWNFSTLDKYVALAEAHNVEILLPLGLTPEWASARPQEHSAYGLGAAAPPKNIEDWKVYVRTVATRYKGRIHDYEIWNEPNSPGMFTGDAATLVSLTKEAYRAVKQVDPTATIVSPAINASDPKTIELFDRFLKLGGANFANVIGYHLYPPQPKVPEQIPELARSVREEMKEYGVTNKQIWDTETGWDIANHMPVQQKNPRALRVLNDSESAAYLARAYILAWASGVSRLYWYAWDNTFMGVVEPDAKTAKPAAVAYGQVENWLVGARMTSCASADNGTWTCAIARDGGYQGWILWNPNRSLSFNLPKDWKIRQVRDLSGNTKNLAGAKTYNVGSSPVLFENQPR